MKNISNKKLKILELCHFSAGGCGVWQRVKQEASELVKKGYEVRVFSSNFEKGTNKIMPSDEHIDGLKIKRFHATKLGGESFMYWNFKKEALKYSPDVIFAHNYRHIYTTGALKVARQLKKQGKKCKVFLVTHAPFVEGDITRSFTTKWLVKFYDKLIGPLTLNRFNKVITISNWEIPYLLKAGAKKEKIAYIPNGIPKEFFEFKTLSKEENKILFIGRLAPKKKLETLISAIPSITNKNTKIEIVGPKEEAYFKKIGSLITALKVNERVTISKPIYDLKNKIKKLDSAKIFVLPSRVEGMPQALIEAMARGKIVLGSNSIAIRDLIKDGVNGYLFEFDNPKNLAEKINFILERDEKEKQRIRKNARKFVEKFSWNNVLTKIEALF